MAETMLVTWGSNDDGQLGLRQASCGSPGRIQHILGDSHQESPVDTKGRRVSFNSQSSRFSHRPSLNRAFTQMIVCAMPAPCPALIGVRVLQVCCGSRHTLAVVEGGDAYSWGWGACGQLGHGDDLSIAVPRVIEALVNDVAVDEVVSVSAGGTHSAAVAKNGAVYTWGGSSYGQLGLGPEITACGTRALPGRVMLLEVDEASEIAAENGLLDHRLSLRLQTFRAQELKLMPKVPLSAKAVSCGGMHTAALTEDGIMYCWGRADSGQLGIGAEWVHETSFGVMGMEWPRRVGGDLLKRRTVSIACGGFHTAALTEDGRCYTWGKEDHGMLGCSNEALLRGGLFCPHRVGLHRRDDGTHAHRDREADEGERAVAIACGGWHTAVIGERGDVWTCGRGEYGRLGLGDQTSQYLLTPIELEIETEPLSGSRPTLWRCSGSNDVHKRTDSNGHAPGHEAAHADVETKLSAPRDPATIVSLGGSHSMVVTSSGKLYGFGRQDDGRLGHGEDVPEGDMGAEVPMEIPIWPEPGWKISSLSCGGAHSAAILVRDGSSDDIIHT